MFGKRQTLVAIGLVAHALVTAAGAGAQKAVIESAPGGEPYLEMRSGSDVTFLLFLPGPFLTFTEYAWVFSYGRSLALQTVIGPDARVEADAELILSSVDDSLKYLVDSENTYGTANHIWYRNSLNSTDRLMHLTEEDGGRLFIGGPLIANHDFDLAESFRNSEPIDQGQLVAVDPQRPDAVRLAAAAYEPTLIGVASSSPGLLLGGTPISVEELRATWGEDVAEEFEQQRITLEQMVLEADPALRAEAETLRSEAAFAAHEQGLAVARQAPVPGSVPRARKDAPSPDASRYADALRAHETLLFDRTIRRFFDEGFTSVALAGRVPVRADASFGAIRPGDPLTSSPIPGVAMKATQPGPVIGTALEALASGTGVVQLFVNRGWYCGEPRRLADSPTDSQHQRIAALEERLALLEMQLQSQNPEPLQAGKLPRSRENASQLAAEGGGLGHQQPAGLSDCTSSLLGTSR